MKLLDRYVIRENLVPFSLALGVLIFVLLANFLIKSIDKLLGKGLSFWVIIEFIYLNMAWILALAVPMAILVSSLMAFGRLSEDNEITAIRASGVSFVRIVRPSILFSIVVAFLLIYFNDAILPEFNHRARLLRGDIYKKRPSLNIEPGYFMDDLPDYSLFVKEKEEDHLLGVLIYSKENEDLQTTIHAEEGDVSVEGNTVLLTLYRGEIHELNLENPEEYRRIAFTRHIISIPVDNLFLERRESSYRGDREMTIAMMKEKVRGYREKKTGVEEKINRLLTEQLRDTVSVTSAEEASTIIRAKIRDLESTMTRSAFTVARRKFTSLEKRIEAEFRLIKSYRYQINRYMVEIHKKFSIPAACIVFVLMGAPLGNMARRGGIVVGVSLSIMFFIAYWAFLIGGEELADMDLVSPFWAMWSANFILLLIGLYLNYFTIHEQSSFTFESFLNKFRRTESNATEKVSK